MVVWPSPIYSAVRFSVRSTVADELVFLLLWSRSAGGKLVLSGGGVRMDGWRTRARSDGIIWYLSDWEHGKEEGWQTSSTRPALGNSSD